MFPDVKLNELELPSDILRAFHFWELKTAKELLEFTWGDFKMFRGIGIKKQMLIKQKIQDAGFDTDKFLVGTVMQLELPLKAKQRLIQKKIVRLEQLKLYSIKELRDMLQHDDESVEKIIDLLQTGDYRCENKKDKYIFSKKVGLSTHTKNILFHQGYYLKSQILKLSTPDLNHIRGVGKAVLGEIKDYQDKNQSFFYDGADI